MKQLGLIKFILLIAAALSVILFFAGAVEVDLMLNCGYLFLGLAVVISVLMPVIGLIQNPKAAVGSLLGLAVVALVVIIAYSFSSEMPIPNSAGGFFEDPAVLKISDTGLFATYAAFIAAVVTILGGEVIRMFK
ncbi:MAG: hypothetical protein R3Y15_04415 [Rikenellaceae bacterium]